MRVYLIRHGETDWNAEMRYQGSQDISLSARGLEQLRPQRQIPRRVYITRMRRTRQTAERLFPGAELIEAEGLQEMCFGDFEGRNYIEMAEDPAYRAWVDGNCLGRCPNGEDREEFIRRICNAFDRLYRAAEARGERELVIVAHGGTQMALLWRHGIPARDYYDWLTGNGRGYLLDASRWISEGILRVLEELDYTEASC